MFRFQESDSSRESRWNRSSSWASAGSIRSRSRSRASAGSIRSRSLSLPPSRASAGSIKSRSRSRASAGSIRSRSLSLPPSRASAGSIRSRSRSRASAGSIRSRFRSRASAGSIRSRSLPPTWPTPALSGATLAQAGAFRRDQVNRTHEEALLEDDGLLEQHGGGVTTQPLLEFQLTLTGQRRTWRDVVNRATFRARLDQRRKPTPHDNLGVELTEALRRAIQRQIDNLTSTTPYTRVHFVMQSDAFTHAFQSAISSLQEFEQGSDRLDTYLQSIAANLSSNQEFTADDSFTIETTFINMPGPGSGHGKKYSVIKKTMWMVRDCITTYVMAIQYRLEWPRNCTEMHGFLKGLVVWRNWTNSKKCCHSTK